MIAAASAVPWSCEAALAAHPDGVVVVDASGRVAMVNREAGELLGVDPSQAVGVQLGVIGLASIADALSRTETTRSVVHVGSRTLRAHAAPIPDAAGVLRGAIVSLRDEAEITRTFEANLQQFLDAMLAPVVIHFEGHVMYANPAVLALLGYAQGEMVGHDIWEFVPPDEIGHLRERLEIAKLGLIQPLREDRFVARDGRTVQVEAISVPLLYRGKTCIASIGRDVTEARKHHEERERLLAEIDAQRQLFRAIYEGVPAGIAILTGQDFEVEMANPAFQAFAPSFTFEGRPLGDIVLDMHDIEPILERVRATGVPEHVSSMPIRVRRTRNGPTETAYFTFAVARVTSPRGAHLAVVGMAVETTEEVKAHRRAAELAEIAQHRAAQLDSIIETMGDAVFVSDRDGSLMMANESGLRLLGAASVAEAARIMGERPFVSRVRRNDGAPTPQDATPLSRALGGESVSLEPETVLGTEGREVFVRANARPIRAGGGAIVGAVEVATDVSPLVEFDRLKDQFIRVAAHELKTPVTIMKGYAQALLRSKSDLPPSGRERLEAINRGADRMDRAVQKLLDLSQLHLGRLQLSIGAVDLTLIVERVLARSKAMERRRIALHAEGGHAYGDPERLEYVVTGLVDNAIRYSPQGGDIDIDVRETESEAILSVRDHGIGVPLARQPHLFERFYRAHTDTPFDFGGMGVDLFLCREMVKRMGGRMWFESEEGRGSTFHVALPRSGGVRAA